MAAGDINSRSVAYLGNFKAIWGTIEVSDTATAFAIADSKTRLLMCVVTSQDGTSAIQCMTNSNDGTDGTLDGSIYCDNATAATETVQFFALANA